MLDGLAYQKIHATLLKVLIFTSREEIIIELSWFLMTLQGETATECCSETAFAINEAQRRRVNRGSDRVFEFKINKNMQQE